MKTIIAQPKEVIAEFVSVLVRGQHLPWGEFSALGLLEGDALVAGIVYNHNSEFNICGHIAAVPGSNWMTRQFLFAMFDYPFGQLNKHRVTALVPKKNAASRKFNEHLGFRLEGNMRQALADDDMLVYGMLRSECKWITVEYADKLNRSHHEPLDKAA